MELRLLGVLLDLLHCLGELHSVLQGSLLELSGLLVDAEPFLLDATSGDVLLLALLELEPHRLHPLLFGCLEGLSPNHVGFLVVRTFASAKAKDLTIEPTVAVGVTWEPADGAVDGTEAADDLGDPLENIGALSFITG